MRKLIQFDEDTSDKLKELARDRMATLQELADEAFVDLLRKHGVPIDLKDALRKSVALPEERTSSARSPASVRTKTSSHAARKSSHVRHGKRSV